MKRGWLDEQVKRISDDMKNWQPWMRRDAGLDLGSTSQASSPQISKSTSSSKRAKK